MFKFVKVSKSEKLIKKISKLNDEIKESIKDLDGIELLFILMSLKQFHDSVSGAMEEHIDSVLKDKRVDLDKKVDELLNKK